MIDGIFNTWTAASWTLRTAGIADDPDWHLLRTKVRCLGGTDVQMSARRHESTSEDGRTRSDRQPEDWCCWRSHADTRDPTSVASVLS